MIARRCALANHEPIDEGAVPRVWNVIVEREGGDEPVLIAERILRSCR